MENPDFHQSIAIADMVTDYTVGRKLKTPQFSGITASKMTDAVGNTQIWWGLLGEDTTWSGAARQRIGQMPAWSVGTLAWADDNITFINRDREAYTVDTSNLSFEEEIAIINELHDCGYETTAHARFRFENVATTFPTPPSISTRAEQAGFDAQQAAHMGELVGKLYEENVAEGTPQFKRNGEQTLSCGVGFVSFPNRDAPLVVKMDHDKRALGKELELAHKRNDDDRLAPYSVVPILNDTFTAHALSSVVWEFAQDPKQTDVLRDTVISYGINGTDLVSSDPVVHWMYLSALEHVLLHACTAEGYDTIGTYPTFVPFDEVEEYMLLTNENYAKHRDQMPLLRTQFNDALARVQEVEYTDIVFAHNDAKPQNHFGQSKMIRGDYTLSRANIPHLDIVRPQLTSSRVFEKGKTIDYTRAYIRMRTDLEQRFGDENYHAQQSEYHSVFDVAYLDAARIASHHGGLQRKPVDSFVRALDALATHRTQFATLLATKQWDL